VAAITTSAQRKLARALGDQPAAAEFCDNIDLVGDVTAGTAAAGKALVLNSSSQINTGPSLFTVTTLAVDDINISGTITPSEGAGAKNGATVTATGDWLAQVRETLLTCAATPLTFGDEAGQGQYGGVKVYDFPGGLILFLGAVIDGSVTLTAPAINAWNGDVGLGLEAPSDHQDAANKAGRLMATNATGTASSKVAVVDAVSTCTDLTESQATWLDGTSTAIDLYFNLLVDDDGAHDNTITGTFTGTIRFFWINLGDK
jgi:hypothetical protein